MRGKTRLKFKNDSEKKIEELKNQLARALADYDNLRKRTENEKEEFVKIASLRLVIRLLPILDMLEEAQKHLRDSGIAITAKEFNDVLSQEGIEKIAAGPGLKFDENVHEALESVEGGKDGEIAEVVLPGWKYKDGPVIRVAKVKVFGKKSEKREELEKEMARGDYM